MTLFIYAALFAIAAVLCYGGATAAAWLPKPLQRVTESRFIYGLTLVFGAVLFACLAALCFLVAL